MISDEMRELLSAYVDGELPHADAARVEDLTKRDAELRREIASYRNLRKKLKDWDEAEHGHAPPPTLARRALSRVQAWVGERREARRGRIVSVLFHPITVAAALLLAIGGGLLADHAVPRSAPPVPEAQSIDVGPVAPLPAMAVRGSALLPYEEPADVYTGGFDEIVRRRMDSWARMTVMVKEQEHFDRRRARRNGLPERVRTGERRSHQLMAMLSTSEPVAKPFASLVVMHQPVFTGRLPAARALRAGARIAMDHHTNADRICVDLRTHRGPPVLAPLGEVWIGARDGSGRTRVLTKSDWIARTEFVAVAWADEIPPPPSRRSLEVQDFVLGPRARKLLLTSGARDDVFRGWLEKNYGSSALAQAFQRGTRKRERTVARLVAALDREPGATGFAFIDAQGKLRGVELFANHALMMAFAPRLLRGYLLEAGERGASLEIPKSNDGTLLKRVAEFLEAVPRGAAHLEEVPFGDQHEERPKGLKRVHVMRGPTIIGHGLVDADYRPVHVSIFD
jgi:hypothetical protein